MRQLLREVYDRVLARIDVDQAFASESVRDQLVALARSPLLVIAFGKAARPMARAVIDLLPGARLRGLVVCPEPDDAPLPPFEVIAGGHPLPTAGSLRAGRRALELARSASAEDNVLFLISGGGSALMEVPADHTVSVDELRALYRALVGCGGTIEEINTVRRWCSAIKGGRLLLAAHRAKWRWSAVISDVPCDPDRDMSAVVASGPTSREPTGIDDCRAILDRYDLWRRLPPPLARRLRSGDLPAPLTSLEGSLRQTGFTWLLDERIVGNTALEALRASGVEAIEVPEADELPYEDAAALLLDRLDVLHRAHPDRNVAVVAIGEVGVTLPTEPGIGGRNQQFALHCATRIADRPITVLSCGTDGIDGNSSAAGAIVDGTTAARATAAGFDVAHHLHHCDAHPLLAAIGDLVVTGPSGTNVRDLRVLLHAAG